MIELSGERNKRLGSLIAEQEDRGLLCCLLAMKLVTEP